MARIRTVKPEFWTSAQVMECSPMARLLFVGMLNFADDSGRMTYSPKTIKAQIYPSDDITIADVERMIVELSSNGLLLIYTADGKELIWITGWHHQKIDKPRASKLPGPFDEGSTTDRGKVATDLKGSEGKGRDREDAAVAAIADPEKDLFARGKQVLGKQAGGLISQLLTAKQKNVAHARAAIETASTKSDPREYIGAVIRGPKAGNEPNWLDGIPGVL